MNSVLELLYLTMEKQPLSNPHYDFAQQQWAAMEPGLPLDVADAAGPLKEEWGFPCFAAGLRWGLALKQELDGLSL